MGSAHTENRFVGPRKDSGPTADRFTSTSFAADSQAERSAAAASDSGALFAARAFASSRPRNSATYSGALLRNAATTIVGREAPSKPCGDFNAHNPVSGWTPTADAPNGNSSRGDQCTGALGHQSSRTTTPDSVHELPQINLLNMPLRSHPTKTATALHAAAHQLTCLP